MRKKKITLLLLVLFAIICAAALSTLRGQTQNGSNSVKSDNQKKITEDFYTVTDYNASGPSDPQKRAIRQARGRRNNLRSKNPKDVVRFMITERSESSSGGPQFDVPPEPGLPVVESDTVLIGEVTDAQAYLSEDKTNIYSEFTTRVNEVLKNNSPALLAPYSSIDIERYGGTVRFPSGKVIQRGAYGKPLPRTKRRYLFFLKYNEEGQDFSLITAYELCAGRVFPLDGLDQDGKVFEVYAAYQKYKEAEEASFLDEVKKAVANALSNSRGQSQ